MMSDLSAAGGADWGVVDGIEAKHGAILPAGELQLPAV